MGQAKARGNKDQRVAEAVERARVEEIAASARRLAERKALAEAAEATRAAREKENEARLEQGAKYPYDAGPEFWKTEAGTPPPPTDWAHSAARGVLADLCDRCGIKSVLRKVDHDVRQELVQSLADIIRQAHTSAV